MEVSTLKLMLDLYLDDCLDEKKFASKLELELTPQIKSVLSSLKSGKTTVEEGVTLIQTNLEKSDPSKYIANFNKKYELLDNLSLLYTFLGQLEGVKELEVDIDFDLKRERDFMSLRQLVYHCFPAYRKDLDKAHGKFVKATNLDKQEVTDTF